MHVIANGVGENIPLFKIMTKFRVAFCDFALSQITDKKYTAAIIWWCEKVLELEKGYSSLET